MCSNQSALWVRTQGYKSEMAMERTLDVICQQARQQELIILLKASQTQMRFQSVTTSLTLFILQIFKNVSSLLPIIIICNVFTVTDTVSLKNKQKQIHCSQ